MGGRALSLALDRQAIIGSVYSGAALMPRWLSNPGTFSYGHGVHQGLRQLPVLTQNLTEARSSSSGPGPPARRSRSAPPANWRASPR
jgi:hypothetical protein